MMRLMVYALVVTSFLSTPALVAAAPTGSLTDLQAAFEAESNTAEMFSSFAQAADREGFPGVGRLLRAIARGEMIHAQNHADVIRSLGAQPRAVIAGIELKSTKENLVAAIEQEKLDRDGRYPWWIGAARDTGDTRSQATLGVAVFVERAHVLLLEEALRRVERGSDTPTTSGALCVSKRSGYVTRCGWPRGSERPSPAYANLEQID